MLLDYSQKLDGFTKTTIERQWPLKGKNWHRRFVGARDEQMWQVMGRAQLGFLQKHGLQHKDSLLDVGCGSLRLGVHAIPFLMPFRYIGIDVSERLVAHGIVQELSKVRGWQFHKPRFLICDDFDLRSLGENLKIDYAIAQSVFTHMGQKNILRCLKSVMSVTQKAFFASFNLGEQPSQMDDPEYPNMVKYPISFFRTLANQVGCRCEYIGDWGIKQNRRNDQMMLKFARI